MTGRVFGLAAVLLATGGSAIAEPYMPERGYRAVRAADLPDPPVTAGDVVDRPYTVIGPINAGVRQATLFSGAVAEEKIYRELWERARKRGADAVVKARYGKSHVNAISWGQTNATGIAIRFDPDPAHEAL